MKGILDLAARAHRQIPDIGPNWLPGFKADGFKVFPTKRGREAQYLLLPALTLPPGARSGVPLFRHTIVWKTIVAAGMRVVFLYLDADPKTLGLSLADLRKKVGQIDCLIRVHALGYPADFDEVVSVMQGKPVIEDCAHALGSTYRGRPLPGSGQGHRPLVRRDGCPALPTRREGFPNVVLEAQACRKPMVATRATGAVDAVVDGVTGVLFPVGDVAALAEALARLLTDRAFARKLWHAGQERIGREIRQEQIWPMLCQEYLRFLHPEWSAASCVASAETSMGCSGNVQ